VFPLTCQCDGAGWVAAAHRVVMDTKHVRLGLIPGPTLLFRHHFPSSSIVDEFNIGISTLSDGTLYACWGRYYPRNYVHVGPKKTVDKIDRNYTYSKNPQTDQLTDQTYLYKVVQSVLIIWLAA